MHIASRMFAQLARNFELPDLELRRLRQTVRLAALFHDLGHAPLSHTTEAFMPPVRALDLGVWQEGPTDRRASHEDYTLKLLVDSELTRRIRDHITPSSGVTPEDVATLVAGHAPTPEGRQRFVVSGLDFMPALRQCVSSELDADRMDYLLRDSYYAGVPYGRYDHEWLLENLTPVERQGAVYIGLDARASFGFEDFLLSRYHMFTSVYFHQIPIGYEIMLKRFFEERTGELEVPTDVERYLRCDDIYLWSVLRASKNPWAQRVVERRAYRMLLEVKEVSGAAAEVEFDRILDALGKAKIHAIVHRAKSELSKYFRVGVEAPAAELNPPLYVVDDTGPTPVEQYSPLYQRYAGAVHLHRIYVEPEKLTEAKQTLRSTR
jgi:HD superfamily phosphohydrolase